MCVCDERSDLALAEGNEGSEVGVLAGVRGARAEKLSN